MAKSEDAGARPKKERWPRKPTTGDTVPQKRTPVRKGGPAPEASVPLEYFSDDEELRRIWLKENRGRTLPWRPTAENARGPWPSSAGGGERQHSERPDHRRWQEGTEVNWSDIFRQVYVHHCNPGLNIPFIKSYFREHGLPPYALQAICWDKTKTTQKDYILTLWSSRSMALRAWSCPPPKWDGHELMLQYGGHKSVNIRDVHDKLHALHDRRAKIRDFQKLWCNGKTIAPAVWDEAHLRRFPVPKGFPRALVGPPPAPEAVAAFREAHGVSIVPETERTVPVLSFDALDFGYSVMTELRASFPHPTPLQAEAWPILLAGRDCIGIAETGCGKTLAFILPAILHQDAQSRPFGSDGPTTLVLVPTRELGLQINEHFAPLALHAATRATTFYGQGSNIEQAKEFLRGVDVVVSTPGRTVDLIEAEIVKFSRVTYVVLDEADRMISMGFVDQTRAILAQTRPDRQTAMFCATWTPATEELARGFLRNPVTLTIHKSEFQAANKNIEQHVHICHDIPQKKEKLHEILMSLPPITNSTRTIIFAQERQVVQALYEVLSTQFAKVAALHGDMKQDERLTALRMLRDEPHSVLVGTEVASRGLDIKGLVCVVNFDMPFSIDTYINNIGRTGRAGQKGFAHSFFEPARDGAIVADLVRCMEESGQEPPLDIYRYFRKNKRKAPVQDDDPDAPAPEASAAPKTSEEPPVPDTDGNITKAEKKKKKKRPEPEEEEDRQGPDEPAPEASEAPQISEEPPVPDTDGNKTSGEKKKKKKRQEPEEEEDRQEPPVVHTGGNTTKAERKKTKKRQEHDEEEDLQEPPAPDTDVDNANATRKKKKKRPDADDE